MLLTSNLNWPDLRKSLIFIFIFTFLCTVRIYSQSNVAFTFDDPHTKETPMLSWQERNKAILQTLDKNQLQATLFVCGHRVNDANGHQLISEWNDKKHAIANHSFDHRYYHSNKFSYEDFKKDFLKNDSLISGFTNYTKLFRFPYLKEGNTFDKRNSARALMKHYYYKPGYVSIDASDWYVDKLLTDTLIENPSADIKVYKELYINHILERANFYDSLATLLTGRKIKHILLLHHNLTSALFLNDLILAFKNKNWKTISSSDAWEDAIYNEFPDIVPAGESIIWALAKSSAEYETMLRYPGEDSAYEEVKFKEFIDARR